MRQKNKKKRYTSKDKKTYIVGNDFKMIVRESDIMYFDVDKILLSESDLMMVNVNTSELNESAEYNISFHGKDSKKPMVMKFIGNNIMSYMATEEGESFDKISVSNNSVSEEFMIAFNPLFIKELCSEIDTEFARMGFRNAKSPVMAYDGDFTYQFVTQFLWWTQIITLVITKDISLLSLSIEVINQYILI